MKNIFFFITRMGTGMLTSILLFIVILSGNVRCELVNHYFRDRREKDYPDTC